MGTVFQELLDKGKEIGIEIGVKEGKGIGMKEGEEKEKWRVVLTCLKKGMDIKTIAELTDLPIERIELFRNIIQPESVLNR